MYIICRNCNCIKYLSYRQKWGNNEILAHPLWASLGGIRPSMPPPLHYASACVRVYNKANNTIYSDSDSDSDNYNGVKVVVIILRQCI